MASKNLERAELLHMARMSMGLTQVLAAQLLGLSEVTFRLWECGHRKVPPYYLALLDELCTAAADMPSTAPSIAELVARFGAVKALRFVFAGSGW